MGPLCAAMVKARAALLRLMLHDTTRIGARARGPCDVSADKQRPHTQAYHSCAPDVLAPFVRPDVVYVGLAGQHAGREAALRALFGGGVRRHAKPSKELAAVEERAEGQEESEAAGAVTCDVVIQSQSPGGQWNEHMYLDRVTVHQGQARGRAWGAVV